MKKRFAMVATVVILAACSETSVEPTSLTPNYTKEDGGAPAGKGDCNAQTLRDVQKGRITPGSCNSNDALDRRSQYYTATTAPAGQQLTVQLTAEFAPLLGIKEDNGDVLSGLVHTAFLWAQTDVASFSFIGRSPTQHVFVTNRFRDETGAYTLTSKVEPVTYSCDTPTIYEAGISFSQTIDAAHACHGRILFSPFPDAINKPLWFQTYYGKLLPGKTYEVSVAGVTPQFNAALTIFRNGAYNPALQSVGAIPADGVRRVRITPTTVATYSIEVSTSGAGTANPAQPQAGTYTLTIREL